jgi:peptidoglycan/xylan/chitin deacetylase (PgdA/CDA1 family)
MKLVSPLLKHVLYPGLAKTGYFRRKVTMPAIITYHGILPAGYKVIDPAFDGSLIAASSFRLQLRLLKEQYNVISPEEFLNWCVSGDSLPPRSVLLTCDDGLRNNLSEMVPILTDLKLSCLFFVTGASFQNVPSMLWHEELLWLLLLAAEHITLDLPDCVLAASAFGRKEKRLLWHILVNRLSVFDHNHRRTLLDQIAAQLKTSATLQESLFADKNLRDRFEVLNASGLKQLIDAGMSLGSHTFSHPMLSRLSDRAAWVEISESRRALRDILGRDVWAFAYPFGDSAWVTHREVDMAERSGYTCAFLNMGGSLDDEAQYFALPRVHISHDTGLPEFEAHLSGLHDSLRTLWRGRPHPATHPSQSRIAGAYAGG